MIRRIIVACAAFSVVLLAATCVAFGAVDVNTADPAQLQAVKGIGPAISAKIAAERQKGDFKDWNDLVTRVPGIGEKNAATMSAGGLTVGGRRKTDAPKNPAADAPVMPVVKHQPAPQPPSPSTDNGAIERATRIPKAPSTKMTNRVAPSVSESAPTTTTETRRKSSTDSTSAPATTTTRTTRTIASPAGTTKETRTSKKTGNDATARTEMAKSKPTTGDTTDAAPKK